MLEVLKVTHVSALMTLRKGAWLNFELQNRLYQIPNLITGVSQIRNWKM